MSLIILPFLSILVYPRPASLSRMSFRPFPRHFPGRECVRNDEREMTGDMMNFTRGEGEDCMVGELSRPSLMMRANEGR